LRHDKSLLKIGTTRRYTAVFRGLPKHRKSLQITANHRNSPQIRFKWLQWCHNWPQISVKL